MTAKTKTIIRDIKTIFEQAEYYYKPVGNFWNNNYIQHESKVIEVEPYQSKNTLMKLKHLKDINKPWQIKSNTWKIK